MFKNITQSYDLSDATWEIVIMLAGAFILGWLFHWIFFPCKNCSGQGKMSTSSKADDLQVIEGIGPKIEELLNDAGVWSYNDLVTASPSFLRGVLSDAGPRFKMHDSKTWPEQAEIAQNGDWDELKKYQDFLIGGKK